ncbi:MAG TPA: response regulator transcription factor, partial [Candidatus Acetothermia bacterium]|nr:response regulator transcription factor [Candidatus Acetothermia bacterium]
ASPLTGREREVVQLIAEGKKTSEIAQLLSRSVATVRAHKASAMRKLGTHTTAELVRKALELRLGGVPSYGGFHERP